MPDLLYPAECPWVIRRPPLRMTWEQLTLLHWRYPVDEVGALVPPGLTVETFDGTAWVGLVPFLMRVDVPGLPDLPRILHFCETNVRTYVRDRRGRPGVWFFSLDAGSLSAVVTARATFGVPYFWSTMTLDQTGDRIDYRTTRRRWPGPAGASSTVEVEIGDPFDPGEADDLDRFLTGRWALFGGLGSVLIHGKMFHEPWPLHHATASFDDGLVVASGLTPPRDEPLVHYSPIVNVRSGWPTSAGRNRAPRAR